MSFIRLPILSWLLAIGCWLLLSTPVFAHQNAHPKVESIVIEKDVLRVEIQYDLSPGDEPRKLRKLFDSDQNGQIDATEREKILDYLARSTATLVLRLDDKKLSPTCTKRSGTQIEGQSERTSEITFVATLEVPLSLSPGLHWFSLAERGMVTVPVVVALSSPLLLVATNQSPADFVANRVGPSDIGNKEKLSLIFLVP
jgi:hypothetical protein